MECFYIWHKSQHLKTNSYLCFSSELSSRLVTGSTSKSEPRQSAWHSLHVRGQGHWRLLCWCRGRLSTISCLCPSLRIWGKFNLLEHFITSAIFIFSRIWPKFLWSSNIFGHFSDRNNVIKTWSMSWNEFDCNSWPSQWLDWEIRGGLADVSTPKFKSIFTRDDNGVIR